MDIKKIDLKPAQGRYCFPVYSAAGLTAFAVYFAKEGKEKTFTVDIPVSKEFLEWANGET